MQQSEFQQIREWYQQFEDAVLFYRMDGTPLWQNHAAALRQDQDGASLPRYAPDGTPGRPARFPSGRAVCCICSGRNNAASAARR